MFVAAEKKAAEARSRCWKAFAPKIPRHDYGYSMMALAETLSAVGEQTPRWKSGSTGDGNHSYPRAARCNWPGCMCHENQPDLARVELRDALADDIHAPKYQRRRDRVWVRRAKSVARKLGGV